MSGYLDSGIYKDVLVGSGVPLRVASERSHFYMGVDIGQKRDHTAIAIVERALIQFAGRDPATYAPLERVEHRLRHLQRLPLGLPYSSAEGAGDSIVDRIARTFRRLKTDFGGVRLQAKDGSRTGEGFTMVVDATGVGNAVVDLLRKEQLGCELVPVTITGGVQATQTRDGWNVPKRDLVTGLQVMYEREELRMPKKMKLANALVEELGNLQTKPTEAGNAVYAGWRESVHDDLVLAVALAVWRARQGRRSPWGRVRLI